MNTHKNHFFKKELGQNFLVNENVISKITEEFIHDNCILIEIGPGIGNLTKSILNHTKVLYYYGIEKDESVKNSLYSIVKDFNFTQKSSIIFDDALKVLEEIILKANSKKKEFDELKFNKISIVCLSSLPYNIGSKIIDIFGKNNILVDKMGFVLQKEVGKKLCANVGMTGYSEASILNQFLFKNKYKFDISKKHFYPIPKVESCFIKMISKKNSSNLNCISKLKSIVKSSFKCRRKKLKNNLDEYQLNLFSKFGIDFNARAESVNMEKFWDIAEFAASNLNQKT